MVDTSRSCRSAPNDVVSLIETCNQDVTEVDRPHAVLDLIEADIVALERCGQKEQAMAIFPDRLQPLRQATTLHDLWFTLSVDLRGAYQATSPNQDLIEKIWAFAHWCFRPARHASVRNVVAVSFYEHLPLFGPARRELPTRLSRGDFDQLLSAFKVTLTEAEVTEFVTEFLEAQGESRAAIRPLLHMSNREDG